MEANARDAASEAVLRDAASEAVLLAGGAAAILLQVADPGVARGVAAASDFAERPLDRLTATLTYLAVIVGGTAEEARAIARTVGQAHAGVPGGRDPELQLWVAATLYETATRVRALVLSPDPPTLREELLAQYAVIGTALGVPGALWPRDRAAFDRYWSTRALEVGDDARAIARALLHPGSAPWWMRALMPTVRTVTAGLLEPELRNAYGLAHDPERFERLVRRTRAVYPHLPRALRRWPLRHYLKRYRRRR